MIVDGVMAIWMTAVPAEESPASRPSTTPMLWTSIPQIFGRGRPSGDTRLDKCIDRQFGEYSTRNKVLEEHLMAMLPLAIRTDEPLMLLGPTGCSKTHLSYLIHEGWSDYTRRPLEKGFHQCNCAAISDSLLQSELFGHRKGAFTGATHDRVRLDQRQV